MVKESLLGLMVKHMMVSFIKVLCMVVAPSQKRNRFLKVLLIKDKKVKAN